MRLGAAVSAAPIPLAVIPDLEGLVSRGIVARARSGGVGVDR